MTSWRDPRPIEGVHETMEVKVDGSIQHRRVVAWVGDPNDEFIWHPVLETFENEEVQWNLGEVTPTIVRLRERS